MTGRITEQSRQDYLDAMGIQTWFPRTVLPNALPHRDFDFPQIVTEPEAAPELSAREAMLALGLPEHQEPSEPAPQPPARPTLVVTPEKAEPRTPATAKKDKPAPATSQFRLVTLAPNDECLVVAEMPHSGLNQFSRFHMRLLNDILRAIHHSSSPDLPVHEFAWPLGNMGLIGQMDQDDQSAADAVCAYLSNQFGLARRKLVLLFGPAAARFVTDPERSFEELRGVQPGMTAEQHFAVSHGLNELMKLPNLKADLWKDLKPLLALQPSVSKHSTKKN